MNRSFLNTVRLLVVVCIGCLALSGCDFDEPDVSNLSNFKLKKIEGKHIEAEFNVDCDNPNSFGFKMKKANIDVLIADQLMGKITLDDKIKIKRKSNNTYTVPVTFDLENGALIKLMQLSLKKEVVLQFVGKVRGSVCGFSKSMDVNETRTIDGSLLQMGQ